MVRYKVVPVDADTLKQRINNYVNGKCSWIVGSPITGFIIEFSNDLTTEEKAALRDNLLTVLRPEVSLTQ